MIWFGLDFLDYFVDWLPKPDEVENFANIVDKDNSPIETIQMKSERSELNPTVMLAFKLEKGKFGQLTYFRLYQDLFLLLL